MCVILSELCSLCARPALAAFIVSPLLLLWLPLSCVYCPNCKVVSLYQTMPRTPSGHVQTLLVLRTGHPVSCGRRWPLSNAAAPALLRRRRPQERKLSHPPDLSKIHFSTFLSAPKTQGAAHWPLLTASRHSPDPPAAPPLPHPHLRRPLDNQSREMASEVSRVSGESNGDYSHRGRRTVQAFSQTPSHPTQERFARKNEATDLKRAFELLDRNRDGKIDADELAAYFAATGHKIKKAGRESHGVRAAGVLVAASTQAGARAAVQLERTGGGAPTSLPRPLQSEIEDMIWEVDEDCDQRVNWEEFQAMYERCRDDKTGASQLQRWSRCPAEAGGGRRVGAAGRRLYPATQPSPAAGTEPRQLFNVVQFAIHDLGNSGKVTLEEAMKLTYLRFGRVSCERWQAGARVLGL